MGHGLVHRVMCVVLQEYGNVRCIVWQGWNRNKLRLNPQLFLLGIGNQHKILLSKEFGKKNPLHGIQKNEFS